MEITKESCFRVLLESVELHNIEDFSVQFSLGSEFTTTCQIRSHQTYYPICVIGKQKVGKSTLNNALWGASFPVSTSRIERTTQGLWGYFHNEDEVFIIDTEGWKSPQKRDDYCAFIQEKFPEWDDRKVRQIAKNLSDRSSAAITSLLWTSCRAIIYYLSVAAPSADDFDFFDEVMDIYDKIKKANMKPHLIIALRVKQEDYKNFLEFYEKKIPAYEALFEGECKFVYMHDFGENKMEDDPQWKESLIHIKDEIIEFKNSDYLKIPCLGIYYALVKDIIDKVNSEQELEDMNCLREKYERKLLDSLLPISEKFYQLVEVEKQLREFNGKILEESTNLVDLLIKQKKRVQVADNVNKGTSVAYSSLGLGFSIGGIFFPPLWIGSLAVAGAGIITDVAASGIIKKSIEGIEKTTEELNKTIKDFEQLHKTQQDLRTTILNSKIDVSLLDKTIFYLAAIIKAKPTLSPEAAYIELLKQLDKLLEKDTLSGKLQNIQNRQSWAYVAFGILSSMTAVLSKGTFISVGNFAKQVTRTMGKTAEALGFVPVVGAIIDGVFLAKSVVDLTEKNTMIEQFDRAVAELQASLPDLKGQQEHNKSYENAVEQAAELLKQSWNQEDVQK